MDLQLSALKEVDCKKRYHDHISGTNAHRLGLSKPLEVLRKNDTLVIWKLDRLGHAVKGVIDLVNQLHQKDIHFKSITDNVDTSTPAGCFFFQSLDGDPFHPM